MLFFIHQNNYLCKLRIDPRKLLAPGSEAIKATVREKIELFGSKDKA